VQVGWVQCRNSEHGYEGREGPIPKEGRIPIQVEGVGFVITMRMDEEEQAVHRSVVGIWVKVGGRRTVRGGGHTGGGDSSGWCWLPRRLIYDPKTSHLTPKRLGTAVGARGTRSSALEAKAMDAAQGRRTRETWQVIAQERINLLMGARTNKAKFSPA